MFYKKVYPDVRMVAAPPSSIGKFGGETDNWMWPRHTGDFQCSVSMPTRMANRQNTVLPMSPLKPRNT